MTAPGVFSYAMCLVTLVAVVLSFTSVSSQANDRVRSWSNLKASTKPWTTRPFGRQLSTTTPAPFGRDQQQFSTTIRPFEGGQSGGGGGQSKITSFYVTSAVQSRFATTNVTSVVRNLDNVAREIVFKAVLPNSAFISNFMMQMDGKTYFGDVKQKSEAQQQYEQEKQKGHNAGLVSKSERESNVFEIATNVAAGGSAKFDLTYQQILQRVDGLYKHILNINPGQVVDDMRIDVLVAEKAEITKFKVPQMQPRLAQRTNAELMALQDDPVVAVQKQISPKLSTIGASLVPTADAQRQLLGQDLSGYLVLLYDVARDASAGELEVVDGYFVQFFAPEGLPANNKKLIFILDKSGSMGGTKIEQLKTAMKAILKELKPSDSFNLITFSTNVEQWKPDLVPADVAHIQEASSFIDSIQADGNTAIHDALQMGFESIQSKAVTGGDSSSALPMIIFLTDGAATIGETDPDRIVDAVKGWNQQQQLTQAKPVILHNIAFGDDANYDMLKKMAAQNRGLARKVFVDGDAALQLKGFYNEISSPLLSEVKIKYIDENVDSNSLVLSGQNDYYEGSEIIAVGRVKEGRDNSIQNDAQSATIQGSVEGQGTDGTQSFNVQQQVPCWSICKKCIVPDGNFGSSVAADDSSSPWSTRRCPCDPLCDRPLDSPESPSSAVHTPLGANTVGGFVERMWAYLTIKKLLEEAKYKESDPGKQNELKQKALELSLKYHFVTDLTSLVVVQSNGFEDLPSGPEDDLFRRPVLVSTDRSRGPPPPGAEERIGEGEESTADPSVEDRTTTRSRGFTWFTTRATKMPSTTRRIVTDRTTFFRPTQQITPRQNIFPISATCTFSSAVADEISYDKSGLIDSQLSLQTASECARSCASNAACRFAIWLPSAQECLLYGQDGVADCQNDDQHVALDEVPAALFCIRCV